jgi:Aerobic-type carbon monoxide dehydrogenase, small subunit CoxS/CutS homologs
MADPRPERVRSLHINGRAVTIDVRGDRTLLSVLREDLDLTGAKYGCGEGQCGACTVLVDGAPVRSCVMPVRAVRNKRITTIEGLEQDGKLHPVQQAFLDYGAFQCAFCTSGMIMAATALLNKKPNPSESEIRASLDGNLCRCGTYPRIIAAVKAAGKALRHES